MVLPFAFKLRIQVKYKHIEISSVGSFLARGSLTLSEHIDTLGTQGKILTRVLVTTHEYSSTRPAPSYDCRSRRQQ